jgi:hypothetical protein
MQPVKGMHDMTQSNTTSELTIRTAAPMGMKHRISPQSAWPLRGADGKTFAERRKEREKGQ